MNIQPRKSQFNSSSRRDRCAADGGEACAPGTDVLPGGAALATNRHARVRCPVCERVVTRRSRQQRYCSPKCMRAANYARKAGSGLLLGQDTALVRAPLNQQAITIVCKQQNHGRAPAL
jgi:hypothetical protein